MKVAIVTHNVVKGDGQGGVNFELVRYLTDRGIDVTLLANRVDPVLIEEGADWISIDTGPLAEKVDLVKVWRFKRRADRLLARIAGRYDVVMACGVTCHAPHTVNAVHFVHGTWLRSPLHASKVLSGPRAWYQWLFSRLNARWEKQVFARAETVVAVSELIRQRLIDVGVSGEKIEVIGNGVDLDEFTPGATKRGALSLPEGVPLGLFVGDVRSPIKNLEAVLRALQDAPSVHVAVAGTLKGSPYPALAERLGVAERVHFLGFCKDVAGLMRAADFLVFPSRQDAFGLVVLEALASGLPVITARTVGAAALVENDCGFVLEDPEDDATLARHMRLLADDAARRRAMGGAAREVAERHSWEKMAKRYMMLFENHTS